MLSKIDAASRNGEVSNVATRIDGAYSASTLTTDVPLSTIMSIIKTVNAQLIEAINRLVPSSVLKEEDHNRDRDLSAFFGFIYGQQYNPDTAIKAAVEVILPVLENYGLEIAEESYSVESAMIEALLSDLAADNMVAALAVIQGATQLLDNLKSSQAEFEQQRIAFDQVKTDESDEISASKLKDDLVRLINGKLVVYLRGMLVVDPETYTGFANTVNTIISENNVQVKMRRKKND